MRCFFERVDFEPCGADHFAHGSTMTTSKEIFEQVYGENMPLVRPYEFIKLSGRNQKISGSKGDPLSLRTLVEIFPRPLILWLYLSRKLMSPIILDIADSYFRYYQEYYRFRDRVCEGRGSLMENQVAELLGLHANVRPDLRSDRHTNIKEVCFVTQSFSYKRSEIMEYFRSRRGTTGFSEESRRLLDIEIEYCKNWLRRCAHPRWVYKLTLPDNIAGRHVECARQLLDYLDNPSVSMEGVNFKLAYEVLFNRESGPRLKTVFNSWDPAALRSHLNLVLSSSPV
jgi:lysyl-tRNA synthetase class I